MAKALTFIDDFDSVEVNIVKAYETNNTFLVELGGRRVVRHRDRLKPLDEEARELLKKQ